MPTLLLVEDDETNQLMYQMLFKHQQIDVLLAKDGEEALGAVSNANNDIFLVLMDLQLPNIDGIEATKRIREIQPDLPIVALTANVVQEIHLAALEAGCCDVLLKPYRCNELADYVKTFINNSKDINNQRGSHRVHWSARSSQP